MTAKKIYTLVQSNVWQGRLYYPIQSFLERVRPDIFVTQEIMDCDKNMGVHFITATEIIKQKLFDHKYAGPAYPWATIEGKECSQYCMTFWRDPLTSIDQNIIPMPEMSGRRKELFGYQSLVHTKLALPCGGYVHVLNKHGDLVYEGHKGNDISDAEQATVANYISTLSGPVIYTGDFNLHRDARSLKPLHDLGMRNLNDLYKIDQARNALAWNLDAVSHVFINDAVTIEHYEVVPDLLSDHQALLLQFSV